MKEITKEDYIIDAAGNVTGVTFTYSDKTTSVLPPVVVAPTTPINVTMPIGVPIIVTMDPATSVQG